MKVVEPNGKLKNEEKNSFPLVTDNLRFEITRKGNLKKEIIFLNHKNIHWQLAMLCLAAFDIRLDLSIDIKTFILKS